MNNLSNTARKLDKVFEIVHIVLGALAIACIVGVALILTAYIFKMDPTMIGTGYENFDIGFLELTVAQSFAPSKFLSDEQYSTSANFSVSTISQFELR